MFTNLLETLEKHNYGVRAYERFSQKCYHCAKDHPELAVYFLLLSLVADNFVNQYDESPLTISVADAQKDKVLGLIDKMQKSLSDDTATRLELFNTISLDMMDS
jgi:hypothetical protein